MKREFPASAKAGLMAYPAKTEDRRICLSRRKLVVPGNEGLQKTVCTGWTKRKLRRMQTKSKGSLFAMTAALCLVLVLVFPAQSQAEPDKPALAGAWIGKGPGASGGPDSKMRLDLIAPGGILQSNKLFGHVTEWPPPGDPQGTGIDDGKVTCNEVSFTVVNVLSKTTLKYKGTVSGSMIKGTVEISRDGKSITHDWSVRRETPKKTARLKEVGSNLSLHWTGSSRFSQVSIAMPLAAAPGQ